MGDVFGTDQGYSDAYFLKRDLNDAKRISSFVDEAFFIRKYFPLVGKVCDVGCSTGEFLDVIDWRGELYGMEVNQGAIKKAKRRGVRFDKSICTEEEFFDFVVFRGTIQHLPDPFGYISHAFRALKKGGGVFSFKLQMRTVWSIRYLMIFRRLISRLTIIFPLMFRCQISFIM